MTQPQQALLAGRFTLPVNELTQHYTASIPFDYRLAIYDIEGSLAHANMLATQGIIAAEDYQAIERGLTQIRAEVLAGEMVWEVAAEDVHMNIEKRLIALVGEAGRRLHTGRSRNDQVATDIRLYLRAEIDAILGDIHALQQSLLTQAEANIHNLMPGLTHLQVAQPISFAHHLLAYFEMLQRDCERLLDVRKRVNRLPLGAAALAGTTYPINRAQVQQQLGFEALCHNSLDAVSDRDFAIEFLAAAAIIMMHVSRLSEELILWMNPAWGFVDIPDEFCTTSSIMPQKKNPDIPELARGKSGRVFGHLFAMLTIMKAQPLAYNKDNQEDKEPLFDTVETLRSTLTIFAAMMAGIRAKPEAMRQALARGHAGATDLADFLVRQGMTFRDAHHLVAKAVSVASQQEKDLAELSLADLQALIPSMTEEGRVAMGWERALAARNHVGGTAPEQIHAAIARAKELMAERRLR